MKRYYVTTHDVWAGDHYFAGKPKPRWHLFKDRVSHYVDLGPADDPLRHILVSADFDNADHEAAWHGHPSVARLQHPASEAHVALSDLHSDAKWAHKRFTADHHAVLTKALGLPADATLHEIHAAAIKLHPQVRLDLSSY